MDLKPKQGAGMDKTAALFTFCDAMTVGAIFLAGVEREKRDGQGQRPENPFVPLNAHFFLPLRFRGS